MPTDPSDTRTAQLAYLGVLAQAAAPGRFLELRWRRPAGPMRRRFIAAHRLADVPGLLASLAQRNDVYVGVALRAGRIHGGRGAIAAAHVAYVDCDTNSAARLARFERPPTMVIASGTPGHLQAYWLLEGLLPPGDVERANRRLARALAGDPACTDAARILRPPGTLNHKHAPPRPVTLLALRAELRYGISELTSGLPEDPSGLVVAHTPGAQRSVRTRLDRELLAIPSVDYVRALAGLTPNREGKVRCPFHPDSHPSLQLYPDGGFYCFGSACGRGGTIFDFAAHLWGIPPRGAGFRELRRRLAARFTDSDLHGRERVAKP